ncbi:hypothetical protein P7K49_034591 [Saguinus oedipus]|uniref:Creatine kinase M-type n=1 Tax=Saguinus oedipus TaxID=9490 RepID=A0ABQ9TV60_SAGOE|nr:hypothetical protein P7K49_034591 [Saguinus oedipus]
MENDLALRPCLSCGLCVRFWETWTGEMARLPRAVGRSLGEGWEWVPPELTPWPLAAAPYSRHNDNKSFLVWVNEEDHLRVISMEKGGNMKEVFRRFCVGLQKVGVHSLLPTSDSTRNAPPPFRGPAPCLY